jgi:hypothetical protein
MKQYKYYFLAYAVFLFCLFTAPKVYSFFDFHISSPYEHYENEKRDWEGHNQGELSYMSFSEWQQADEDHSKAFIQELGEQIALSFDPWFEPATSFEREVGKE